MSVNPPSAESTEVNGAPVPAPAPTGQTRSGLTAEALRAAVSDHLLYSIARPPVAVTAEHYYRALSLAVRDRMQRRWMATTQDWLDLSEQGDVLPVGRIPDGPAAGQ